MLTNLYNCTCFNLFWNFAPFMLHFILHIFFSFYCCCCCCCCCFIGKRLINFYSQKWNTWWWNNCEMKELGTTYSCCNSFPWIGFIKFWNHLANSLVYLVHSRAGLQSKTYSIYSTEDNRDSLLVKVFVQSFCGIWSGNRSLKYLMKHISYFQNRTISHYIQTLSSESLLLLTLSLHSSCSI